MPKMQKRWLGLQLADLVWGQAAIALLIACRYLSFAVRERHVLVVGAGCTNIDALQGY